MPQAMKQVKTVQSTPNLGVICMYNNNATACLYIVAAHSTAYSCRHKPISAHQNPSSMLLTAGKKGLWAAALSGTANGRCSCFASCWRRSRRIFPTAMQ